jgi:hypothetical protein
MLRQKALERVESQPARKGLAVIGVRGKRRHRPVGVQPQGCLEPPKELIVVEEGCPAP